MSGGSPFGFALPQLASDAPDAYAQMPSPSALQQAATGSIPDRFVGALQAGGLTNPNGLGAVAAYAQHESRYSPSNITGSWSDPSESGEAGTSGGILSWRGDRLDRMRAFTAGASDPVTAQAQFTLAENPRLTAALQNAGSPEEAHRLMADAWKFAGYNRPGGENAARLATTQDYAGRLAGGMQLPASAGGSSAPAGFGLGGPTQGRAPFSMAPPAGGAAMTVPGAAPAPSSDDAALMKAIQGLMSPQSQQSGQQSQGAGGGASGGSGGGKTYQVQAPRPRPFALMRFPGLGAR